MNKAKKQSKEKSFNDKLVDKTIIPIIYLWILSAGAVVGMGLWKPEAVIPNLDGFIALIAIVGGIASPALGNILRLWEAEQQTDIDDMPTNMAHTRERHTEEHRHRMDVEKHQEGMTIKKRVIKKKTEGDNE